MVEYFSQKQFMNEYPQLTLSLEKLMDYCQLVYSSDPGILMKILKYLNVYYYDRYDNLKYR